ncbi:hypothetical protein D3C86_1136080 [compost metagenome]
MPGINWSNQVFYATSLSVTVSIIPYITTQAIIRSTDKVQGYCACIAQATAIIPCSEIDYHRGVAFQDRIYRDCRNRVAGSKRNHYTTGRPCNTA